jgi:NAD-specific glutamate dehydrogenase
VVRAFVVVEALTGARALAARAADAPSEVEARVLDVLLPGVEGAVRWLLATYASVGAAGAMVARFQGAVAEARRSVPEDVRARSASLVAELVAAGAAAELADACVALGCLRAGLEIVDVAAGAGVPPPRAAGAYWGAARIVDFAWLRRALEDAASEDRWERRAVESLIAELDDLRRQVATRLLGAADVDAAVNAFEDAHAAELARIRALLDDLRSARRITLPAMIVVVRELGRLEEDA